MLGQWIDGGGDPNIFWALTPKILFATFEARTARQRVMFNDGLTFAWVGANLPRHEEIPPLERLLIGDAPEPEISDEDVAAENRQNIELWRIVIAQK